MEDGFDRIAEAFRRVDARMTELDELIRRIGSPEDDLTRGGPVMSAPGAQCERETGRQGQTPAISPAKSYVTTSSVAGRPSLASRFTLDVIVSQLAKARVKSIYLRRCSCAASAYLPPRSSWKRPPASDRRKRSAALIAQQSILRTVNGFRRAGKLGQTAWGRRLLELVAHVNARIDDAHFAFHPPRLLLRRKNATSFRCLASYEDIEDRIVLNGLAGYLRESFDPFISAACHSFRENGGLSHHSAVQTLIDYRTRHPGVTLYVAECDIMKFFDAVDHREALGAFDAFAARCGTDPRARTLIRAYLDSYTFRENVAAAVREDPSFARNADRIGRVPEDVLRRIHPDARLEDLRLGIPQGGALSPLFANILLAPVDEAVLGDGRDPDLLYLRFCDDMILVHTDRAKCEAAMDRYLSALARLRLPAHPPAEGGFVYGADYYRIKTKAPFAWRAARVGERNAAPWVSFLGYQVDFSGAVRIRRETLDRHRKNLKAERIRFDRRLTHVTSEKGRLSLVRGFQRYLIAKGIGRLTPGAIRENTLCWASAFPLLRGRAGADGRAQMRSLDALRERLLRFPGVSRAARLFYGRPFSYLGYLLRMKRPSLRTLRRRRLRSGISS